MKVESLFTPIRATVSPDGGDVLPGDFATIDTNIPANIVYTLDGTLPRKGAIGTTTVEAPAIIELKTPTSITFYAYDSRAGKSSNRTRTRRVVFTMDREHTVEEFKINKHFFKRLVGSIVDSNFYNTDRWVVPISTQPYSYLFINRSVESRQVRLLHNGIDILSTFPVVASQGFFEFNVQPISGANSLVVQARSLSDALSSETLVWDEGEWDVDTWD